MIEVAEPAENQQFLSSFGTLFKLSATTLGLMVGVGAGVLVLGAIPAWLIASFQFKGRSILAVLLVLPLALPTYISAYVYVELLSYSGIVQTTLRELFAWQGASDYYFPSIYSLGGAIVILSLGLYPYIYIASLGIFIRRTSSLMKAGRVLGLSEFASFFKVALPLARPTLFAVLMLVFMECLNDIGVVEYLGVRTLTLGLYDTWLNRGSLSGATQIALWVMAFRFYFNYARAACACAATLYATALCFRQGREAFFAQAGFIDGSLLATPGAWFYCADGFFRVGFF